MSSSLEEDALIDGRYSSCSSYCSSEEWDELEAEELQELRASVAAEEGINLGLMDDSQYFAEIDEERSNNRQKSPQFWTNFFADAKANAAKRKEANERRKRVQDERRFAQINSDNNDIEEAETNKDSSKAAFWRHFFLSAKRRKQQQFEEEYRQRVHVENKDDNETLKLEEQQQQIYQLVDINGATMLVAATPTSTMPTNAPLSHSVVSSNGTDDVAARNEEYFQFINDMHRGNSARSRGTKRKRKRENEVVSTNAQRQEMPPTIVIEDQEQQYLQALLHQRQQQEPKEFLVPNEPSGVDEQLVTLHVDEDNMEALPTTDQNSAQTLLVSQDNNSGSGLSDVSSFNLLLERAKASGEHLLLADGQDTIMLQLINDDDNSDSNREVITLEFPMEAGLEGQFVQVAGNESVVLANDANDVGVVVNSDDQSSDNKETVWST